MRTKTIIAAIQKAKRFLISTHVNPDPDALCSELALADFLRGLGKKVTIVNEEAVPERFLFFPGTSKIKSLSDKSQVSYDVAIVVDCGDYSRIGKVQSLICKDRTLINIDHHITNDSFGDLNLVEPKASSTAEVLYDFIIKAGGELNKNMAMLLYTGIMTDTGSFRYANTSWKTHKIASELRKFSFSADFLYRNIYEAIPYKDIKGFIDVASRFDLLFSGQVACLELTKETVKQFSKEFDLRETIFKFLRSIKGLEVILILTEVEKKETRVNLRSAGKVNVGKLAHFYKGGGHKNASGCTIDESLRGARKLLLKQLEEVL